MLGRRRAIKAKDFLRWARERVAQESEQLKQFKTEARRLLDLFDSVTRANTLLEPAQNARQKAFEKVWTAEIDYQNAEKAGGENRSDALIKLLKEAKTLLDYSECKTCPLCEQPIAPDSLRENVTARLAAVRELLDLEELLQSERKNLDAAAASLARAKEDFIQDLQELCDALEATDLPLVRERRAEFMASAFWQARNQTSAELAIDNADGFLSQIADLQVKLNELEQQAARNLSQRNLIRLDLETYDEKRELAESAKIELDRLQNFLEIVEGERKKFVENVLDEISVTVQSLYKQLHPTEKVGDFRFFLKQNVAASLEFAGRFESAAETSPQGYYSESHLDTLGICIFLAMVERREPKRTIVVLDDVLTSVDFKHLERFAELVQSISKRFGQIIISTHYQFWRDEFKNNDKIQLLELADWNLRDGLQARETKFENQILKDLVAHAFCNRQQIASGAGILLEAILNELSLIYEFKMPRRVKPFYELGGLLDAAINADKENKDGGIYVEIWEKDASAPKSKIHLKEILANLKKCLCFATKSAHTTIQMRRGGRMNKSANSGN